MNPFEQLDRKKQGKPALTEEEINRNLKKHREGEEYIRSWGEIYHTRELRADYYYDQRKKIDDLLKQLDEIVAPRRLGDKRGDRKEKEDVQKNTEEDAIWRQIREIQENLALLQKFF